MQKFNDNKVFTSWHTIQKTLPNFCAFGACAALEPNSTTAILEQLSLTKQHNSLFLVSSDRASEVFII